jgi:hypothetical protein
LLREFLRFAQDDRAVHFNLNPCQNSLLSYFVFFV